jgi:hypothetical protein
MIAMVTYVVMLTLSEIGAKIRKISDTVERSLS